MNTVQNPAFLVIEQAQLQLRMWWYDLDGDGQDWVKEKLGDLIDIMEIKPREDLIKALVTFWDPTCNVFRFSDFELTPTLEEIAGYIDFGRHLRKQELIFPRAPSVHKFFDLLNISKQMKKAHVSRGYCSFQFLYSRFGHSVGFETHEKGLCNKQDKSIWQIHRRFAFMVAFLGIIVFPNAEGTIDIRMAKIAQVLTTKENHTLAPLVLADVYRALTLCKSGAQFFEGCNILLQMWLIEHLRHHPKFMSYGSNKDNFIKSYKERVKDYNSPEGFEAWVSHLRTLKASQIEWTIGWLPVTEIIHMMTAKGYLMLMGLRSVQPYAPQRVLRQLRRYQVVPEDADLSTQVIELHPEATLPEALVQRDWNGCRYLKNDTQVPNFANGEVDPDYAKWFEKRSCTSNEPESELEPERPAKRPHVQAFDDKVRERLAWGDKEKEYQATIHTLEEKLRNVVFDNDLQVQAAEGERKKLVQENEALRAQIQRMRIAAENPARSRKDEKLISSLRRKVCDYGADLGKAEEELAKARAKLAKKTEERVRFVQQLKGNYDREVMSVKKKLTTRENEMAQQTKNFKAEREHCYSLIYRLEESLQQLQNQNNTDAQVLGARAQQIGRLLQEKGVIRARIKEIADYVMMKCHECEDMTRSMFFAFVMTFVHQVMADLDRLQQDIARRPTQRPDNAPQAPEAPVGALMYF